MDTVYHSFYLVQARNARGRNVTTEPESYLRLFALNPSLRQLFSKWKSLHIGKRFTKLHMRDTLRRVERKEFYQVVGARIREIRRSARRGQKDLAARLDLSRESISNIEAGRHAIQLHVAVHLAEDLGVSLSDLLPEASMGNGEKAAEARELFKTRVLRGPS